MNPQPKQKRIIDKKYIDWIKKQRDVSLNEHFCGDLYITIEGDDIVPAHQNILGGTMGGKTHDIFAVPMYARKHLGDTVSDHNRPDDFWGDTDKAALILSYILKYASETGKTINGMDFNLWLLKTIAENW